MKEFETKLKDLLMQNHISQTKFATDLYFSKNQIHYWLNGKAIPNIEQLKSIAEYFKVSTDYLLGLENEDYTKTYDYSIEKIKSDLASDSNAQAKLDMKNKIENIAKDKKIPLEKLSNLSEEQIKLLLNIINNFK